MHLMSKVKYKTSDALQIIAAFDGKSKHLIEKDEVGKSYLVVVFPEVAVPTLARHVEGGETDVAVCG